MTTALISLAFGLLIGVIIALYRKSNHYATHYLLYQRQSRRQQDLLDDYCKLVCLFKTAARNNWQLKIPDEFDFYDATIDHDPNEHVMHAYNLILDLNELEEVPREPLETPKWRYIVTAEPVQTDVHRTPT